MHSATSPSKRERKKKSLNHLLDLVPPDVHTIAFTNRSIDDCLFNIKHQSKAQFEPYQIEPEQKIDDPTISCAKHPSSKPLSSSLKRDSSCLVSKEDSLMRGNAGFSRMQMKLATEAAQHAVLDGEKAARRTQFRKLQIPKFRRRSDFH